MYEAGEIAVPGGGGTVVIPVSAEAIVFFGTNWTALDSIDTSVGTGIFMGFAGPDLASPGSIHQHGIGILPDGVAMTFGDSAILAPDPAASGGAQYIGTVTALGDSVTIVFTSVIGSGRIFYLAMDEFEEYAVMHAGPGGTTKTLGWKALTVLADSMFDVLDASIDGVGSSDFFHGATWGAAGYNPPASFDWSSVYLAASSYPTSILGQGISELLVIIAADEFVGMGTHFLAQSMITGPIIAIPSGVGELNLSLQVDADNFAHFLAWTGVSQASHLNIPTSSIGNEVDTEFDQLEAIDALIGFSVSDAPQGQLAGAGGAAGFCIVTEDFQACAIVDAMGSRGAFQSATKGWASFVDGGSVRAGEVDLNDDNTVTLRTTDGGSAAGSLAAIALEGPEPNPGFFRHL